MLSRRLFVSTATAALVGLRLARPRRARAASPALDPFRDPLPIPGKLSPSGIYHQKGRRPGLLYRVRVSEFHQQLHRDLPPTTVWGYAGGYPGPSIGATSGRPIYVQYVNDLPDTPHPLWSDDFACVHGPGIGNTAEAARRIVTHLHGSKVPHDSDGWPEAHILPGEATQPHYYPNIQEGATLWYHDHALGITRLNVMMGLAGFYLLRDPYEMRLPLPKGAYDIPLAIQDRTFNADGSLFYPDTLEPEVFGDTLLVNGKVMPFLEVARGKYRFRLLNGCNSRFLTLRLNTGATFRQIASEQGLLPGPVAFAEITLAPGERTDVVVDFAGLAAGAEVELLNYAAPEPFKGPNSTPLSVPEKVMQFKVANGEGFTAPLPDRLRRVVKTSLDRATRFNAVENIRGAHPFRSRTFTLEEAFPLGSGEGFEHHDVEPDCLNAAGFLAVIADEQGRILWDDPAAEVRFNAVEEWSFVNNTVDTHPIHLHLVQFQVMDRSGGRVPNAEGPGVWKDTVQVDPGETVRIRTRFEAFRGPFPFHCHILEHEDHEMMRYFVVK